MAAAGGLGQQTVEFSSLVRRAAEESFLSLKELVDKSAGLSDSEKKISLLKYVVRTRQRMLRLNVLAKWCQQMPLVQYCQQLGSTLSSHDTCFTQAADYLFFTHESLQQARAPVYDVPSAIEVLRSGTYDRLPKCIEDIGKQTILSADDTKSALQKLDMLLRSRLLEVSVPKEISQVTVSGGTVSLRVSGEFRVLLTLGYRGHLSLWRILHIELLVGDKNGPVKLEESHRNALRDDLERRMSASENVFIVLYSILHEFCTNLVMDTVIRQLQMLRQSRWKDALRFELISDGTSVHSSTSTMQFQSSQDMDTESSALKTPGLRIFYWLDFDKSTGPSVSDLVSPPFIKIEPGQDMQIRCSHSGFVIDPQTGNDAEFLLDYSFIDVEQLLLRAIICSRHTRLLEIHKELESNNNIYRVSGDVLLRGLSGKSNDGWGKTISKIDVTECGEEILCVRAYGSSYIILGINIRNGSFFLRPSESVISPPALVEFEEALNQRSRSAAEVFISLRVRCILQLFSSMGRFLGLKVYEQGLLNIKIPKSILHVSDHLLMEFPQCGSSYYLLIQLDGDFKPSFTLLESQQDQSGRSVSFGDSINAVRFCELDIKHMQVIKDDVNMGLLDWDKLHLVSEDDNASTHSTDLSSDFRQGTSAFLTSCQRTHFSSIADEVFEIEKGAPVALPRNGQLSSVAALSSYPHHVPQQVSQQSLRVDFQVWEGGSQVTQLNHVAGLTSGGLGATNPYYHSSNSKNLLQSSSMVSVSSDPAKSLLTQKTLGSKPDPDTGSSYSSVYNKLSTAAASFDHLKTNYLQSSGTSSPLCQLQQSRTSDGKQDFGKSSRKRSLSYVLEKMPLLKHVQSPTEPKKKQKIAETLDGHNSLKQCFSSFNVATRPGSHTFGSLLTKATSGHAPPSIYFAVFLHVVRHCSLSIKHARLTRQMDDLDIPYVEEVGLQTPSSNIWFRLPSLVNNSWQRICLQLGKTGSMCWDVRVNDQHFTDIWDLQKGGDCTPWGGGVRVVNTSDADSHIQYDSKGVILSYMTVEESSIRKLVEDLQRVSNARVFALGMRKLLGVRADDKLDDPTVSSEDRMNTGTKSTNEIPDKMSDQIKKLFKIEAVGLTSLWFSYYGSMHGVIVRFLIEWEAGKEGCTVHVSPDQVWPHTKFLEDFINGGEVSSLLDCIRLTSGPLLALTGAIRPSRMGGPGSSSVQGSSPGLPTGIRPSTHVTPQGIMPNNSSSYSNQPTSSTSVGITPGGPVANLNPHHASMLSAAGRGGGGIAPSAMLPVDVSVVLRGPYWIRIIYRKNFAVDMRCFAADHVWVQPATPPKGGPTAGGSLPCPQFRPFIVEHVAQGMNNYDTNAVAGQQGATGPVSSNAMNSSSNVMPAQSNGIPSSRISSTAAAGLFRPPSTAGSQALSLNRISANFLGASGLNPAGPGLPVHLSPGLGVPIHVRSEWNTAFIGIGDDGGYGGAWVPLAALKKVLRSVLKYLGVLWLFAQLPDLIREILSSTFKENEGSLLNLDMEQPALRFFVGGYVFAVSVHRMQLYLQVLSVKRLHHQPQQQQQQQQNQITTQEELTQAETTEIGDYFSRRVASEPYDASRVASFVTLLTAPVSVLREFLKLISWKKGLPQVHVGDGPVHKPRVELRLESHPNLSEEQKEPIHGKSSIKSNIHYDRAHDFVDFGLTIVMDHAHIPHINAVGGATWLPYCVYIRLRYHFGENTHMTFLGMEGSHGGQACWTRPDDWERCKQKAMRVIESVFGNPNAGTDGNQGKLRMVAERLQLALQSSLQQLKDGSISGIAGT